MSFHIVLLSNDHWSSTYYTKAQIFAAPIVDTTVLIVSDHRNTYIDLRLYLSKAFTMASFNYNLLTIPFEIRSRILEFVFVDTVIDIYSSKRATSLANGHWGVSHVNRRKPRPQYVPEDTVKWAFLGILFVNHQLHEEAFPLAMSKVTFKVDLAGLNYPADKSCLRQLFPEQSRLANGLQHIAAHHTALNIFCSETESGSEHVLDLLPDLKDITVLCGSDTRLMDALTCDGKMYHCRDKKLGEGWTGPSVCSGVLADWPKFWHQGVRAVVEQRRFRVEFQLNGGADSASVVTMDPEWVARLETVHPEDTLSARMRDCGVKMSWGVYWEDRRLCR